MERPGALRLVTLLTIGIAAVSSAAIFVRLASAPALAVASYRVLWATLLLAPFATRASSIREWTPLSRSEWLRLLVAGGALALHFALWIASLSHTSVASSVLLVDTTPFFVGLARKWLLGKSPAPAFWSGLAVAFTGCIIIFREDWLGTGSGLLGNSLALGGAIAMAIYFLAGASLRTRLSLVAYVWPVYGTAALFLVLTAVLLQTPLTGYSKRTHLFLWLLGLLPQSIGHTSYNWSLRWLQPEAVALITLAEPVVASFLAYLVLDEGLTAMKLIGGAVVLAGIYLSAGSGRRAGSELSPQC